MNDLSVLGRCEPQKSRRDICAEHGRFDCTNCHFWRKPHEVVDCVTVPASQLEGAVDALYAAHDFISRTTGWKGEDGAERDELLAEIEKHFPTREAAS